jgi:hypothetical protein
MTRFITATLVFGLLCAPAAVAKRQGSSSGHQAQERPVPACSSRQLSQVRAVRSAALARIQTAKQLLRGDPQMGSTRVQDAQRMARAIFGDDLQRVGGEDVLLSMQTRLNGPSLQYLCPPASHRYCNLWDAATEQPDKVYLCPSFFSQSAEQKKRTLIHESAHLARILTRDEQYCNTPFSCGAACPNTAGSAWDHADNWAQWVNCATGAPRLPEDGVTLRARRRRGRTAAHHESAWWCCRREAGASSLAPPGGDSGAARLGIRALRRISTRLWRIDSHRQHSRVGR